MAKGKADIKQMVDLVVDSLLEAGWGWKFALH